MAARPLTAEAIAGFIAGLGASASSWKAQLARAYPCPFSQAVVDSGGLALQLIQLTLLRALFALDAASGHAADADASHIIDALTTHMAGLRDPHEERASSIDAAGLRKAVRQLVPATSSLPWSRGEHTPSHPAAPTTSDRAAKYFGLCNAEVAGCATERCMEEELLDLLKPPADGAPRVLAAMAHPTAPLIHYAFVATGLHALAPTGLTAAMLVSTHVDAGAVGAAAAAIAAADDAASMTHALRAVLFALYTTGRLLRIDEACALLRECEVSIAAACGMLKPVSTDTLAPMHAACGCSVLPTPASAHSAGGDGTAPAAAAVAAADGVPAAGAGAAASRPSSGSAPAVHVCRRLTTLHVELVKLQRCCVTLMRQHDRRQIARAQFAELISDETSPEGTAFARVLGICLQNDTAARSTGEQWRALDVTCAAMLDAIADTSRAWRFTCLPAASTAAASDSSAGAQLVPLTTTAARHALTALQAQLPLEFGAIHALVLPEAAAAPAAAGAAASPRHAAARAPAWGSAAADTDAEVKCPGPNSLRAAVFQLSKFIALQYPALLDAVPTQRGQPSTLQLLRHWPQPLDDVPAAPAAFRALWLLVEHAVSTAVSGWILQGVCVAATSPTAGWRIRRLQMKLHVKACLLDQQWQRKWQGLQAKLGSGEVDLTEDKRVFAPLPVPWHRVPGVAAVDTTASWDRPYVLPSLMLACLGPCLGAVALPADAPPSWRDASTGIMMAHVTQLCIVREISARMHGHTPGGDELVPVNLFVHSTAGFAPMHSAAAFLMMCGAPLGGFSSPINASAQMLLQYAWQCVQPVDVVPAAGGPPQLRSTSGSGPYRGIAEACSTIAAAVADTFRTIAPGSHASMRVSSAGAASGEYGRKADEFSWDVESRKMSGEAKIAAIQAVGSDTQRLDDEAYYFGKFTYEYAVRPVASAAARAADLARRTIVSSGSRGGSGADEAAAAPASPTISAPIMASAAHVPPAPLAPTAAAEVGVDSAAPALDVGAAISATASTPPAALAPGTQASVRPLQWLASRISSRVSAAGSTILGILGSAPAGGATDASQGGSQTADAAAAAAAARQPSVDASSTSSAPPEPGAAAPVPVHAAEADLPTPTAVTPAAAPDATSSTQLAASSFPESGSADNAGPAVAGVADDRGVDTDGSIASAHGDDEALAITGESAARSV